LHECPQKLAPKGFAAKFPWLMPRSRAPCRDHRLETRRMSGTNSVALSAILELEISARKNALLCQSMAGTTATHIRQPARTAIMWKGGGDVGLPLCIAGSWRKLSRLLFDLWSSLVNVHIAGISPYGNARQSLLRNAPKETCSFGLAVRVGCCSRR